ncbi:MAG: universal stress protein [Phreatobacter sp.]|nr:universal stress protein [Phreatobacter sp.]
MRLHGYEVDEHPNVSTAPPADVIDGKAAHSRIEVLVMGAYGHRGLKEFFLGSTTQSIMGAAKSFDLPYH